MQAGNGTSNDAVVHETVSINQSISITQSNTTGPNTAVVIQVATVLSLAASANQSISITQTNVSGPNTARVSQTMLLAAAASARNGTITEALDGHQNISVSQDSGSGANAVEGLGGANPLTQSEAIIEAAIGSGGISQEANASPVDVGPNMSIDVEQDQNTPTASGANSSAFSQTSLLTLTAVTPNGPVTQAESSASGGLQATVNQSSSGLSTSNATQTETQLETASTRLGGAVLPPGTTQIEAGPVRCCSLQGSNPNDTFAITQSSTQCAGTAVATCTTGSNPGSSQTDDVVGTCQTTGNCTVTQTVSVDGVTTTHTQSGMEVTTSTTCTGSTCTFAQPTVSIGPLCVNGDTVALNGAVNWQGQEPGTISFDWGDETTSIDSSFPNAHTYETGDESEANYTITVTATDGAGSGDATYPVTVGPSEETCSYSFVPAPPIAESGTLEAGATVGFAVEVDQDGEPLDGAPVWLTFTPTEGGGSVTACCYASDESTSLSTSPQVFVTGAAGTETGQVELTYTAPEGEQPECETDTVEATDSSDVLSAGVAIDDSYDYACIP